MKLLRDIHIALQELTAKLTGKSPASVETPVNMQSFGEFRDSHPL